MLIAFYCCLYRNDEHREEYLDGSPDMPSQAHGSNRSYPSHEWSPPITDLSPIEDVPLTMELEAEAEWLAYQRNGMLRWNSLTCCHVYHYGYYMCM